jgi:hypothetical protein
VEKPEHRHRRLLRAHRERPCRSRTAEKRDELAPTHIRSQAQETQHCTGSNEYFDRAQTGHQNHCRSAQPMSLMGLVSRVSPVHTAMRNCTRDEGRSFEVGNQVLISSHRKLLSSKAMVVNVAEKSEQDFDRHD